MSSILDIKRVATDLSRDLTTLLARNAYDQIETDDDAFKHVRDGAGHSGSQSRKVDVDSMELAQKWATLGRVKKRAPFGIHLEHEELSRAFDPDRRPHPFFFRLDDFDGTSNACATAGQWATACLCFIHAKYDKYVLAGGTIALFDGHVVSFVDRTRHSADGEPKSLEAEVSLARFDTFAPRVFGTTAPVGVSTPTEIGDAPSDGASDMIAVNAASGSSRFSNTAADHPRLMVDAGYRTLTAGTPIVYAALRSHIGMIVDPGASTLHDSTHLFILNALGWRTVDLKTLEPINLVKIAEDNATRASNDRPIPPNATYRTDAALALLFA